MPHVPFLGEILSVTAALCWAVSVILFRRAGETIPPLALNVFKNVVATALLVPTVLLSGHPLWPDRPVTDWLLLAGSALLGISIADTLFFLSLNRLGAGLVAVVDTLYSPAVIVLSLVFLGEHIGPLVILGATFVVGAIVVGAAERPPAGHHRREIVEGVLIGALGMILMAIGIVMIKRLLDTTPILWASFVRLLAGAVGLSPLLLSRRWRAEIAAVFRPSRAWRFSVPASVLGAYVAMIAWIGGMKYTLASISAVLNQLSTIFIFLFAALFLKEPLTPRRTLAVLMAMAGAVLVARR